MEEPNPDLEILDVENYRGGKDQQFSQQFLVMRSMNKCIDAGCKEMRPGYYNEKYDKFGNKILVYIPDTRKEFIESVKTCEMNMTCDYDTDSEKKIKDIKDKLDKEFTRLCKCEKESWDNLGHAVKKDRWMNGIYLNPGTLSHNLPHYQEYIESEVDYYREIFGELKKLAKRLNWYQEEEYEA